MSKEMVEVQEKHGALMVSKSGKTAWHSYTYKKADLPLLIADIENQYHIHVENNHMNIIEDTTKGTITHYFTKSGMNAIANNNQISTKVKIMGRKLDHPFAFEVLGIAILPNGTSHEFTAIGSSTMDNKERLSVNQILAWTQTKARIGAIGVAMEIQNPSWEEMEDLPEMRQRAKTIAEIDNEILSICPSCKGKGWSKLQKHCMLCGITYETILQEKEELGK